MATFRVTNIVDGDTFDVTPNWTWKGKSGNRVRPTGYDTPEEGQQGFEQARNKLFSLIYNKEVELGTAYRVDRARLVCDVFLNGRNLASYFPEYAT
jgi:endonuclease YncB( thermonuclease family)